MGRSGADVHDLLLLDHLGRGSGHRGQRDHVAAAGRAPIVQDADDDYGMLLLV